jgi:hypothetical protein
MRSLKLSSSTVILLIAACLSACSNTPTKSPDVADNIRKSLDQANLKDVNSQSKRAEVEKMATKVVNELQAKNQKATSSS